MDMDNLFERNGGVPADDTGNKPASGRPASTPEVDMSAADEPKPVDERVTRLTVERAAPQSLDIGSAVVLTELQEIKERVDVIGSAAVAGVFLLGMLLGFVTISYYGKGS